MRTIDPPRSLTTWERAIISLLAPGASEQRLAAIRVHEWCSCGCASVSFRPTLRDHHLVAEAQAIDQDGMNIWVLLFGGVDGDLDEIEIQRADGTPILTLPLVASIQVVQTTGWK